MIETDKPLVLIAEDDDSSFLLLQVLLKKEYRIVRAINGREAVQLVREQTFDAILMDIRMPEVDGVEALRQIRQFNTTVPVIMQSANAFESDKQAALQAGCSGFVTKPIVSSLLKETLKNILGGGKKDVQ